MQTPSSKTDQTQATKHLTRDGPEKVQANDTICLFLCHNEARILPDFLRHYRSFGDISFLAVDDNSTDATREILVDAPDVTIFQPVEGSTYSRDKRAWRSELLDLYAADKWCLVPDVDEHLIWKDFENQTFESLLAKLEDQKAEALFCVMVDMYRAAPIAEQKFPGQMKLRDFYPLFDDPDKDPLAYRMFRFPSGFLKKWRTPQLGVFGGARDRLFFASNRQRTWLTRTAFKLAPPTRKLAPEGIAAVREKLLRPVLAKRKPTFPEMNLTKLPLVKWKKGGAFNGGAHASNLQYRLAKQRGVLLHFAFSSGLNGINYLAKRRQHAENGRYYQTILDNTGVLAQSPVYNGTSEFRSSRDMEYLMVENSPKAPKPRFRSAKSAFHRLIGSNTIRLGSVLLHAGTDHVPTSVRDLLYRGEYEFAERHFVEKYVSSGDRVMEIGAGIGAIGLTAAKICGEKNVICFEANAVASKTIRANFDLNNTHPTLIEKGVTVDGNDFSFFVMDNIISSSSIDRGGKEMMVSSVSINDAINTYQPTVLVVDAEGAEIDLLTCGPLDAVKTIIVETHTKIVGQVATDEMINNLTEKGFDVVEGFSKNLVLCRNGNAQRP